MLYMPPDDNRIEEKYKITIDEYLFWHLQLGILTFLMSFF